MNQERVTHTLSPIYDATSRVLILGSMPSPKSRETGFYYGHPQNRFWRVMSYILNEPLPQTNDEKRSLLMRHHIALWDVLFSCDICGAADQSIQNPVANDLNRIIKAAPIGAIFATGRAAERYYNQLCRHTVGQNIIALPSTSAANCRYSFEKLAKSYEAILPYLAP